MTEKSGEHFPAFGSFFSFLSAGTHHGLSALAEYHTHRIPYIGVDERRIEWTF